MHGVINLLKPPGMTSHDAVAFVRRVTGIKRVGHTGTLDPAASGVLPICVGQATRLVEYLQAGRKRYVAEARFGHETDTLDAVGQTIRTAPAAHITAEAIESVLDRFRGPIQQTPPMYSAIKQGGKKLYELARGGEEFDDAEIKVREVEIYELQLTQCWPGEAPRAIFAVECSGGTYIRSLVRDIARALDSAATMTFLVRTESGHFPIGEAHTLEQLSESTTAALVPMAQVLKWCASTLIIDDEAMQLLAQGRPVAVREWEAVQQGNAVEAIGPAAFLNSDGTRAAITRLVADDAGDYYRAEKVLDLSSAA